MTQRRAGSKFDIQNSSSSSSSRSSSASLNKNAKFDKGYRDSTPFSTTTAESSDDDNGIARDTTPTTPTTPTPIIFKQKKQISYPLLTSPQHASPLVIVPQPTPQPPEISELPASDNMSDEFNHFRRVKKRIFWTPLELEALENGMKEYGTQWARILRSYGGNHGPLRNRNAVQLKDKARNEKLRRIKSNLDLGVFCMATGGDDITEDELVDDS